MRYEQGYIHKQGNFLGGFDKFHARSGKPEELETKESETVNIAALRGLKRVSNTRLTYLILLLVTIDWCIYIRVWLAIRFRQSRLIFDLPTLIFLDLDQFTWQVLFHGYFRAPKSHKSIVYSMKLLSILVRRPELQCRDSL